MRASRHGPGHRLLLAGCCLFGLFWAVPGHPAPLEAAIDALAGQPEEGIPVYLQVEAEGFWPRQLQLRVEGRPGQLLRFTPAQARALAGGGIMRLLELPREAPALELELQLARSDDPAAPLEVFRRSRLSRTDLHQAAVLSLRLRRSIWRAWRTVLSAEPGAARPPALEQAAAALQLDSGDPLAAAVSLRRLELADRLDGSGQLLLGDARAALGLDASSQWRMAAARQDAGLAARAALRLAEAGLRAGRADEARYWQDRIEAVLPEAEQHRAQALRIRLGLNDPAALDDAWLARGPVALASYNQAAADAHPAALLLLERLGGLEMADDLAWAVRDQTNLALGYRYLRLRQPEQAHAAFARVRTQGPQSAAGRLGLGWAQITPGGGAQRAGSFGQRPELRPRGDEALAEARRATPFRTASGVAQGELAERLRRALVPWTDMIGADPLDPAVQEVMLAIPYALGHLGAHDDALQRTRASIETLQQLRHALARAAAQLDAGQLAALSQSDSAGRRWWRDSSWPDDFFAQRLAFDPAVHPILGACGSLQQARERLGDAGADYPALRAELGQAQAACQAELLARSRQILAVWGDQVGAYLAEAHLALARMHDPARRAFTVGAAR